MGEPEIAEEKIELSEGEPHPAEMLATLLKAESGGGARRTLAPAPAIVEESPATAPSPVLPVEIPRIEEVPAAARALAAQPAEENQEELSGLLRAIRSIRSALPLVQRLLPLLDGNVIAAITNILAPRPQTPQAQKAVDTAPLENGLTELKAQQKDLQSKVQEQSASLQRLAEVLDRVREAIDGNTDDQTELIEELKTAGKKMNIIAFLGFALLAASIALNVVLYLQIHHMLP
jgi:hypothetical protein